MSAPEPESDVCAVDEHRPLDSGQIEPRPVVHRRAQHASRSEEVVRDQGRRVHGLVVDPPVVHQLDGGHDCAHRRSDGAPVVRRAVRRKICAQSYRHLALDAGMEEPVEVERARALPHGGVEDCACARVRDAQEALHHGRRTADLVARRAPHAAVLEQPVQGVLDAVGLDLVRRPQFGRQQAHPLARQPPNAQRRSRMSYGVRFHDQAPLQRSTSARRHVRAAPGPAGLPVQSGGGARSP